MLEPRPTADCPVERALLVLDGRWSVLIIRDLLSGPKRFGELRTSLGISSPKTLTERLRILEHQGILTRTVYAEVPPRVVYELTERGHSFRSVLEAMAAWGDRDLELDADCSRGVSQHPDDFPLPPGAARETARTPTPRS